MKHLHHSRPSRGLSPRRLAFAPCLGLALSLAACENAEAAEGSEPVDGLESAENSAPPAGSGPTDTAVIRYTEYGIPHIRAADYDSVGFAEGYAQARDNLCKIEVGMLALDGQLSRHFGPDGLDSTQALGAGSNLGSDLYFQGLNDSGVVERLSSQPAPLGPREEVRQLARGYARGFNARLAEAPATECSGQAWLRPMTELDVYRRAYALTTWLGQGVASGAIVSAQPPAVSAPLTASIDVQPVTAALRSTVESGRTGSNAVALGAAATETGFGLNVANPHLGWTLDLRWWQGQLTVPGQLDVSGGAPIGLPLMAMGHTERAAWSITTTEQTRRTTLFELHLVDGSPTSYLVDGEPEAMQRRDVSIVVRHADGSVETITRPQWWTRYGAVVASMPWTAGTGNGDGRAYALADPNTSNMRMLNLLFALNHAQSVGDVLAAVRDTQGAPWWTVIAADADGQTLFSQIQVVPHVTDEHAAACVPELWQGLWQAERDLILDGSRSACAWGNDDDALQPGTFGPGTLENPRMPLLIGADYVVHSNGSHWMPNAHERLEGLPAMIGDERTARDMRTRGSIAEIEQQLGQGPFTRQAMADLVLSNRSHAAELALDATLQMCEQTAGALSGSDGNPVDAAVACAALARWDGRMNVDSRGALLFDRYWRRANQLADESGLGLWTIPFDAEDPLHTPRGLDTGGPLFSAALADALVELEAAGIDPSAPLGDHQFIVRGGKRLALGGGGGGEGDSNLGVFNILDAEWDPSVGYSGKVSGSTYMHVVSFDGSACPDAVTLVTYSQSEDSTSPHHIDQTELYSEKRWVEDRFCEEDILHSPVLELVRLQPHG